MRAWRNGRRACLRGMFERVWVQVPPLAPRRSRKTSFFCYFESKQKSKFCQKRWKLTSTQSPSISTKPMRLILTKRQKWHQNHPKTVQNSAFFSLGNSILKNTTILHLLFEIFMFSLNKIAIFAHNNIETKLKFALKTLEND